MIIREIFPAIRDEACLGWWSPRITVSAVEHPRRETHKLDFTGFQYETLEIWQPLTNCGALSNPGILTQVSGILGLRRQLRLTTRDDRSGLWYLM